jgi:ATP-dependent protease Clp ATPase subunit
MLFRNRLACSFCGKSAADVSKLVAGPKVYICNSCVAAASRIMNESDTPNDQESRQVPSAWHRFKRWVLYITNTTRQSLTQHIAQTRPPLRTA